MEYPDARIAEVCGLGQIAAEELLTKAQGGDAAALMDWTIRAAYRSFIVSGSPPEAALQNVRMICRTVDFLPRINP